MEHQFSRGHLDATLASLEVSNIPKLVDEDYRLLGNKLFKNDQFCQALVVYSKGLKFSPNNFQLLANRAKTYLKMRMFDNCLHDCDRILLADPINQPATLCRLKALANLTDLNEISSANAKDFQQLIKFANQLKLESEGNFDFPQLYRENLRSNQKRLDDHSDYIGPVAIQHFLNAKGRGLVATKDIQPGQLIMASKALECAFHSDKLDQFESPFDELLQRLTDRSLVDPQALQQLLQLYSGPDVDELKENEEIQIADDLMKDPNKKEKIEAMCERVVLFNAYGKNLTNGQIAPKSSFSFSTFNGLGLWVLPSYINHECYSNAASVVVGDTMFVRAVRHIKCGEEITQPYCVPIGDLHERRELLKRFGFTCSCQLCKFDVEYSLEHGDKIHERAKLMKEILSIVDLVEKGRMPMKNAIKDKKLLKMANKFQAELSFHNRFDVDLMIIWKAIGDLCSNDSKLELATTAYQNALTAWKGKSSEHFLSIRSSVAEIPIIQKLAKLKESVEDRRSLEKEIELLLLFEFGVTDLDLVST